MSRPYGKSLIEKNPRKRFFYFRAVGLREILNVIISGWQDSNL